MRVKESLSEARESERGLNERETVKVYNCHVTGHALFGLKLTCQTRKVGHVSSSIDLHLIRVSNFLAQAYFVHITIDFFLLLRGI